MELLIWLIIFGVFLLLGLYFAIHALYLRTKGRSASSGLSRVRRVYLAVVAGILTSMVLSMVSSPLMGIQIVGNVLQLIVFVASILVGVQTFRMLGRRKSRS